MDLFKFKIEEMYQFAAEIEQGGYDFYVKLIEATDNPRVKNELKYLRDEEARHKAFFMGELKKKSAREVKLSGELNAFLSQEFVKPLEEFYKAKKIGKGSEALRFGMALEQKTIDFYTDLCGQASDAATQKDIEAIIEEEKKHKQKLNIILAY